MALNNLRLQIKSTTSRTKLHILNWSCTYAEASFDLDSGSTLLDKDNDLEEEIAHLCNELSIFI